MIKNSKSYKIIDNRYLAFGLAFFSFKFIQEGFGKDARYLFEESVELTQTVGKLLTIQKELGN